MQEKIIIRKTWNINFKETSKDFSFDRQDVIKCYSQEVMDELDKNGYYVTEGAGNILIQIWLTYWSDFGDQINFHAVKMGFEEFFRLWIKLHPEDKGRKHIVQECWFEDFYYNVNMDLNHYFKEIQCEVC